VSTSASVAQAVYGTGPRGSSSFSPTFLSPPNPFSLDPGVNCPTPSFSVTGFAGHANDYANNSIPYTSSNSGLGNYGVTMGFSVPLGGNLRDFCTDFAALRTSFERKRVEIQLINAQVGLIKQCLYLNQYYNFEDDAFKDGGQFATLSPCLSIIKAYKDNQKTTDQVGDVLPSEPFSPKPVITFPTQ
jgi:hypothetical protein